MRSNGRAFQIANPFVPVDQRIERRLPKAKRALLLVCAPVVRRPQNCILQLLATTSVSSPIITNPLIFDARVTQTGDTIDESIFLARPILLGL